jgi:hypothetical protein
MWLGSSVCVADIQVTVGDDFKIGGGNVPFTIRVRYRTLSRSLTFRSGERVVRFSR